MSERDEHIGTDVFRHDGPTDPSIWEDPDRMYAQRPPWDIDHAQPAFQALADAGELRGRVLDIGCGTGEHALLAAAAGLDATGVDLAGAALDTARRKAAERGLTARFVQYDARRLGELGETFDTVLDCGLLHLADADWRSAIATSLTSVVRPGGRYLMLGFSDRQPGDWGPHRLTRAEIEETFDDDWRIDSLQPATIEVVADTPGTVGAAPEIAAWLAVITRV